MADEAEVDGRYYEVVKTGGIAARLARIARERMHALFLELCAPGPDTRILDVGVSDVLRDEANMLERSHAWPEAITAVGLGEARAFQAAFPAVHYQRIAAGTPLPFADGAFDIAVSNGGAGACGQRGGAARVSGGAVPRGTMRIRDGSEPVLPDRAPYGDPAGALVGPDIPAGMPGAGEAEMGRGRGADPDVAAAAGGAVPHKR